MSDLALELIKENKKSKATSLDLRICSLKKLPKEIVALTWLEELILGINSDLRDLSPLQGLSQLKQFTLLGSQVNNLSPLKELKQLRELNILNTPISDLSPLQGLNQLNVLSFSEIQVSDLSPLAALVNLQRLYVSYTQVSNLSPLAALSTLQALSVHKTQVSDLSPLQGLNQLQLLDVSSTQVSDLSPLVTLGNLQHLLVSSTQVSDLSPLVTLGNLQGLDVSSTQVSNLSPLKGLSNLQALSISSTQVINLSPLSSLVNLQELYISYTQVSDLCPLSALGNLRQLYVHSTQVSDLSPLKGIIEKGIPVKWDSYGHENGIYVEGCPLINPPKEIVKQGNEAILSYWKSLEEAKEEEVELVPINEIKILMIGEGMAGKTSLLKKIKGLPFDIKESQTHGVIIEKLPFKALSLFKEYDTLKDVIGRFWDFGGQEIMHASHQFFLSNRSIYILLIDSRTDDKKEMWLKHIQKFGRDSPSIVAITKYDENRSYDVERSTLNDKFPFINNRFHKISSKTGEHLNDLAKEIAELIPQTEIFKTKFHPDWIAVKEQLEAETAANKYIDQARFEKICIENSVNDKTQQKTLLNYLDSLGIALHFEKLDLQNFYVLDPHWVTIGVYKIINSGTIKEGLFNENQLDYILNQEEIKKEEYDPAKEKKVIYSNDEQRYLVKIMQQFELLYLYDEARGMYLVPDLLPKEPKEAFSFDEKDNEHIRFVMKYDFLPPSLMSRFIIRMKNDIHNLNHLWRTGVELFNQANQAKAIVKADKSEKRIVICVTGNNTDKRAYFSIIRNALWEINGSFKDLEVKEFMPLPDNVAIEIEYEELIGYERNNRDDYFIGKLGKSYSVSKDFLNKISTKEQRMQEKEKKGDTIHITQNFHGGQFANVVGKMDNQYIENQNIQQNNVAALEELVNCLKANGNDAKFREYIETLPEPEDEAEKITMGKQIINWVKKNAEGFALNIAASNCWDAIKAHWHLFGS